MRDAISARTLFGIAGSTKPAERLEASAVTWRTISSAKNAGLRVLPAHDRPHERWERRTPRAGRPRGQPVGARIAGRAATAAALGPARLAELRARWRGC